MAIVSIHSPADNSPSHITQLGTNQSLLCEVEQVKEKPLAENADPSSWTSLTKYDIKMMAQISNMGFRNRGRPGKLISPANVNA
jgi:hypothetical protein